MLQNEAYRKRMATRAYQGYGNYDYNNNDNNNNKMIIYY